jgi:hypothetical protein
MTEQKTEKHQAPQVNNTAKRKVRNFLLMPILQVKLGLYAIILAALASLATVIAVRESLSDVVPVVIELTDAKDEVTALLTSAIWDAVLLSILIAVTYILVLLVITVWYTHRLIGPTIAFRRHVTMLANGQYFARTNLRKGDAFFELADDLNKLSDVLQGQQKQAK